MLYRNIHPILYQDEVAAQWDEDIDGRIKHVFKSGLDRGDGTSGPVDGTMHGDVNGNALSELPGGSVLSAGSGNDASNRVDASPAASAMSLGDTACASIGNCSAISIPSGFDGCEIRFSLFLKCVQATVRPSQ